MGPGDREYVFLLCAILYIVAVGVRASCAFSWLAPPRALYQATLESTKLCSGDVLLWASLSKVRTDLEKLLSGSQYTHVSMVFVDRRGVPFVWESLVSGPRVRRLDQVLAEWRLTDLCFLRKLNKPVNSVAMERFIRANLSTRYSFDMWRAVVQRWCATLQLPEWGGWDSGDARFCSQLVADTLEHLGALDLRCGAAQSNLLLPGDFAVARSDALPWTAGFALGPEIQLVRSFDSLR